jgi:hypothetical protein
MNFLLAKLGPKLLSPFESLSILRFSPTKYLVFWRRSGSSRTSNNPKHKNKTRSPLDFDEKSGYASTNPPNYSEPQKAYVPGSTYRPNGTMPSFFYQSQTTRRTESRPGSEYSVDLIIQHPTKNSEDDLTSENGSAHWPW